MPDADATVDAGLEKIQNYEAIFTNRQVNGQETQSLAPGFYSMEYSIWNANYEPGKQYSMSNGARVNPMYLEVNDEGEVTYYMTLQWLFLSGLRGHLLEMWRIPATTLGNRLDFGVGQWFIDKVPTKPNEYRNQYVSTTPLREPRQEDQATVVQYIREQGISQGIRLGYGHLSPGI